MGKQKIIFVVVAMVFLAVTGQALAERSYTHELTVGMDANDPNYDPNSNYTTINAAIVAMEAKSPPLSSTVLGCIRVYPETYEEHLNDYYEPNGHDLPAHCDLTGMGDDINDVVIQHERSILAEINIAAVKCDGDNIVSNLMVENTSHGNNQNSVEIGGYNGHCELKDCIIKSYHRAVLSSTDSLVVSGCEITGYYLPCITLLWSYQTFEISNTTIIPKTRSWGGECPVGISSNCPGSIDNVTIQTSISSSDYVDHLSFTCLGGIAIALNNPGDLVTITDSTIDLTLTTIYNDRTPPETETWDLFGVRNFGDCGEIVIEDCNITLTAIESNGSDPNDPNDDGQGIRVSGIYSDGTGNITVQGNTHINTSRTTASNAEDGYEYLLNNESGTRTLDIDFDTVTFDPNGTGDPNCYDPNYTYGDMNAPYRAKNVTWDVNYISIQAAINDANDGDVIEAFQGWHFETIDFNGVSCTLRSVDVNDWDVVAATIIDADGNGDGITIDSSEDANTTVSGLTITGATGTSADGVYCGSTSPTIEKCVIKGNFDGVNCSSSSSATIRNCKIYDSTSAGVRSQNASAIIINSWIYENLNGITMANSNSAPVIKNNTIVNNTSYGIFHGPGTPTPTISNCIVWGHDSNDLHSDFSATYSCIEDPNDASGTGNITGDANDPCFVDANNDDYRILSTSSCFETGDPNGSYSGQTDIEGQVRVYDGDGDGNDVVDIGADENDYPAIWYCATQCHGDVNCDGDVDILDWPALRDAIPSNYWSGPYDPSADFNRDGHVDLADYEIFDENIGTSPSADCNDGAVWPPRL